MNTKRRPKPRTPDASVKITVQVWRLVTDKLTRKLQAACLRRDAYLNRVLQVEIAALDEEVSIANSELAQRFVQDRLETFDRKIVSLTLRADLVDRLNDVCSRKRIVRDAFFNRLFLLLAAKPEMIDRLYFGGDLDNWRSEIWSKFKFDSSFFDGVFYPLEPEINPLWPLRESLHLYAQREETEEWTDPATGQAIRIQRSVTGAPQPVNSVYTARFDHLKLKDGDLRAFSVYLPDGAIPDTVENRAERQHLDDLLVSLGELPI